MSSSFVGGGVGGRSRTLAVCIHVLFSSYFLLSVLGGALIEGRMIKAGLGGKPPTNLPLNLNIKMWIR